MVIIGLCLRIATPCAINRIIKKAILALRLRIERKTYILQASKYLTDTYFTQVLSLISAYSTLVKAQVLCLHQLAWPSFGNRKMQSETKFTFQRNKMLQFYLMKKIFWQTSEIYFIVFVMTSSWCQFLKTIYLN